MNLEDLGAAIEEHSHYQADDSDRFWENLIDKYWDKYKAQTARPSYKDFRIWAEENDLVGEDEIYG